MGERAGSRKACCWEASWRKPVQGEVWRKRGGGGEMREGFREEESGLRT